MCTLPWTLTGWICFDKLHGDFWEEVLHLVWEAHGHPFHDLPSLSPILWSTSKSEGVNNVKLYSHHKYFQHLFNGMGKCSL